MYEGMPLSQLETAETIPQGSTFPMVAGNGSGTKKVTKETMVNEMGEALKIGNLQELQTTNKESLVSAINEVKQSGGGGASVDILDSEEEIEANTESGKVAGALAMKEMFGLLNDKLKGFEPVIDQTTGKITGYKTSVGGADAVFPFSGFDFENCSFACVYWNPGIYSSLLLGESKNENGMTVKGIGIGEVSNENYRMMLNSANLALSVICLSPGTYMVSTSDNPKFQRKEYSANQVMYTVTSPSNQINFIAFKI